MRTTQHNTTPRASELRLRAGAPLPAERAVSCVRGGVCRALGPRDHPHTHTHTPDGQDSTVAQRVEFTCSPESPTVFNRIGTQSKCFLSRVVTFSHVGSPVPAHHRFPQPFRSAGLLHTIHWAGVGHTNTRVQVWLLCHKVSIWHGCPPPRVTSPVSYTRTPSPLHALPSGDHTLVFYKQKSF